MTSRWRILGDVLAEPHVTPDSDWYLERVLEKAASAGPWPPGVLTEFTNFAICVHALNGAIPDMFVGRVDGHLGVQLPGCIVVFRPGNIVGYDNLDSNMRSYPDSASAALHLIQARWVQEFSDPDGDQQPIKNP